MKKYIFFLLPLASLTAQTSFTLQEAIQFGVSTRYDLKNKQLNTLIARNEYEKLDSRALPTLKASADARYNAILQTNVLPGSIFSSPANPNPENQAVQFGTNFNTQLGLQATYPIYDPELAIDREIALQKVSVEESAAAQSVIDVKLAIAEAYYGVLLSQEKLKLDRENIARQQTLYEQVKRQFQEKTALQNDLDRRWIDLANAQTVLEQDAIALRKSRAVLANRVGLPSNYAFTLREDLSTMLADTLSASPAADFLQNRVEMQQENANFRLNQLNIAKYSRKFLPTVSAYGSLFEQQLSNNFNVYKGSTWYPYAFVGVQASVDIFDGHRRARLRDEFAFRQQMNENTLERLKLDLSSELETARLDMDAAIRSLRTAQRTYQLAQDLIATDKIRLAEGTTTAVDLANTTYSMQQAQNTLLNSLYNFLVARLRYQKAMGQL